MSTQITIITPGQQAQLTRLLLKYATARNQYVTGPTPAREARYRATLDRLFDFTATLPSKTRTAVESTVSACAVERTREVVAEHVEDRLEEESA